MVSATMTLASDAIDWIERSMPPSMMTKVTPVARMNSTAVSPASWSSVDGSRKAGCDDADHGDQDDQRGERQPLPQPVRRRFVSIMSRHRRLHHVPDQIDLARLVCRGSVGAVGDRRRRA